MYVPVWDKDYVNDEWCVTLDMKIRTSLATTGFPPVAMKNHDLVGFRTSAACPGFIQP